jgi:acetyl esterase/lipase
MSALAMMRSLRRIGEILVARNHRTDGLVCAFMRAVSHWSCAILCLFAITTSMVGQASKRLANSATTATSPAWGDLQPGTFSAGFKSLFRYDASRTWKSTRNYSGAFSPDIDGRPIQISIWYPANADPSDKRMVFADYVDQSAPAGFAQLNSIMKQRSRDDAASAVPRSQLSALQSLQMNAYRNARPATGRFPVVLYFAGLSEPINSNAIMAEYLASHGYVVASISLIGPSEEETFQSRTSNDFEATVRDMEFAWSILQDEPNVDRTHLAVMGHSVGAIEAVILGMRNGNVSAVIGLDGTYGFEGLSSALTSSYGYDPGRMRAAFLDLRRAQGAQGNEPLDLSAVESFRHSDRTFITIDKMHHSDFTSFAMIGAYFHTPLPAGYPPHSWNRETGRAGYETVCRIVLATLDADLKSDSTAIAEMEREIEKKSGITIRHETAVPPPPSPLEAAALINSKGLDAAKAAFTASCGQEALASCMNVDRFNTWGYNLLGKQQAKGALAIFQLNAWAHPESANAQDSLADGFNAVGDKASAKSAIERAIALAPGDPSLDAAAKSAFLSEENTRLQQFR